MGDISGGVPGGRRTGPGNVNTDPIGLFSMPMKKIVVSQERARLQGYFDALTGLFDRAGLRINKGKMVSTAFRPCYTPHAWSTEAYTQRVTRRGLSYMERLRHRVHLPE